MKKKFFNLVSVAVMLTETSIYKFSFKKVCETTNKNITGQLFNFHFNFKILSFNK